MTTPAPPNQTVINPHAGPKTVQTYRYTMQTAPHLNVSTAIGTVTITAGTGRDIVVTVTRRGGSDALMNAVAVKSAQSENTVKVSSTLPDGCTSCSASYDITVPSDTVIDASSDEGSVGVNGVSGNVNVHTKHGPVLCAGLSGNVKLASEDGFLNAAFNDVTHVSRIVMGTANGGVRLLLPAAGAIAHLKAGTANGTITSPNFTLNVVSKNGGAGIDQTFGSSGPDVVLGTASGPITIIKTP